RCFSCRDRKVDRGLAGGAFLLLRGIAGHLHEGRGHFPDAVDRGLFAEFVATGTPGADEMEVVIGGCPYRGRERPAEEGSDCKERRQMDRPQSQPLHAVLPSPLLETILRSL